MDYDYETREAIKRESWPKVYNPELPLSERVRAAIKILECWYAKSREFAKFHGRLKEHIDFKGYVAAILGSRPEHFPADVKKKLIELYGVKRGVIPNGSSYYPLSERGPGR